MSDYGQTTLRRHRRLSILRYLDEAPEYTSNRSMLRDVLNGLGVTSTADQVVTEIAWLAEQGLVATADGYVVTATERGVEVARGVAAHPDVQRPAPGAGRGR